MFGNLLHLNIVNPKMTVKIKTKHVEICIAKDSLWNRLQDVESKNELTSQPKELQMKLGPFTIGVPFLGKRTSGILAKTF